MRLAIDGACVGNGKPECISAGGLVIEVNTDLYYMTCNEFGSTSQRGEIKALILALEYVSENNDEDVMLVTDSEYLFNTMTKNWIGIWKSNKWITSAGTAVKNKDLWEEVDMLVDKIKTKFGVDDLINYYHIKGHMISMGEVTARRLLSQEGIRSLLTAVQNIPLKAENAEKLNEVSKRINGFELPTESLRDFVNLNMLADVAAKEALEEAKEYWE